jgi:hypothetical protein
LVFRLPFSKNTLIFGGHILRWSRLKNSLEVALRHLKYPDATNEDCQQHNLQIFTEVKSLVEYQRKDSVEIKWLGGSEGQRRILRICQVCQHFQV